MKQEPAPMGVVLNHNLSQRVDAISRSDYLETITQELFKGHKN